MALITGGNRTHSVKTVSSTAELLSAESSSRRGFFVQNQHATDDLIIGSSDVTASGATKYHIVAAGGSYFDGLSKSAWYGIRGGSNDITASVSETF